MESFFCARFSIIKRLSDGGGHTNWRCFVKVGDLVRDNKNRYGVVIETRNVHKPYLQRVKEMFRILLQGQTMWVYVEDCEVINESR